MGIVEHGAKGPIVADSYACVKCGRPIERGESSISTVKNLKRQYYHARCFGADHLDADQSKSSRADSERKQE